MPESQSLQSRPISPAAVLSERTLGELRTTIGGQIRLTGSDSEIRRVMRELCFEARTHGLQVEKVIVLLKGIWQNLHDSEGVPATRRSDILDRFITICIEEFYALHRESPPLPQ